MACPREKRWGGHPRKIANAKRKGKMLRTQQLDFLEDDIPLRGPSWVFPLRRNHFVIISSSPRTTETAPGAFETRHVDAVEMRRKSRRDRMLVVPLLQDEIEKEPRNEHTDADAQDGRPRCLV